MSYGKRYEKPKRGKLNIFKVIIVLILVACAILGIYKLLNKKDNTVSNKNEEQLGREIITKNDIVEEKVKTIDDYMNEYNGVLLEKKTDDTYYIAVEGKEHTLYSDGSMVEGKIEIWDGTSKELKIEKDTKVLNISSPKELKWIADQVISGERNFSGITIVLDNNIDLGGRVNGDETSGNIWNSIIGFLNNENTEEENLKGFLGTFDGNDKWIKGLIIDSDSKYQGLFGYSKGNIKNLTIKDSYIKGNEAVGAFVGLNAGRIESCKLDNTKVIGNSKVGGFVGINMTESSVNRCYNSYNNCSIEGQEYIGGIVGYVNNNSSITECQNKSNLHGKTYVGGIAGISFYGTEISACSCINCTIDGEDYIGGLLGYSQALIENSFNQAGITGKTYVGGIAGLNYIMGNISNCYNAGNIVCDNDYLGGIAGVNNATIVSCYNKGNLACNNPEDSSVGGICSQNLLESAVNNSYNIGNITGKGYIDGVVGSNFGSVSKCYYLESTIKQKDDNAKNEEEMKGLDLGEDFKIDAEPYKNNGYLILNWQ